MQRIAIYQVLPRLYGNENSTNKHNGTLAENGCGKFSNFTMTRLRRLREFGYTHVWYTGILRAATTTDYSHVGISPDNPNIVKGRAGSPYAIKDYYDVNPDLADVQGNRLEEFRDLLRRTHDAGLKVIIDFVPNHVSREYKSISAPEGVCGLGENDDCTKHFSPQNNFYYLQGQSLEIGFADNENPYREYPARATGNDCFTAHPGVNDWYETVKLNYGIDFQDCHAHHFCPIPDTWNKMTDILLYWAKFGVDGFRCDMAEMVPPDFWAHAISRLKSEYPDIVFIAEVYNPSLYREYILHGGFDYLYDKVGLYDCLRGIISDGRAASSLTYCWQSVDDIRRHMLSFLENHDEQRIASDYFAADARKAIPAMAVALCWGTNPFMIYAGQEIGERGMDAEGFSGTDGRTSIFDYWSPASLRKLPHGIARLNAAEKKLYAAYKRLICLQNDNDALREGSFFDLMYVNPGEENGFNPKCHYAFIRATKRSRVLALCNFSPVACRVNINIPEHAFSTLNLPRGKRTATELMTGTKESVTLAPDKACPVSVGAYVVTLLSF